MHLSQSQKTEYNKCYGYSIFHNLKKLNLSLFKECREYDKFLIFI